MKKGGSSATYKLCQWANDWISADGPDGPEIVDPLEVTFTEEETKLLEQYQDRSHVGHFWLLYEFNSDKTKLRSRLTSGT